LGKKAKNRDNVVARTVSGGVLRESLNFADRACAIGALGAALTWIPPWYGPSWQAPTLNGWVLHHHFAFLAGKQCGTDIVLTLGPFGLLYYGITPGTAVWVIGLWCVLAVAYWLASLPVLRSLGPLRAHPALCLSAFVAVLIPIVGLDVPDAFAFTLMAWILLCVLWHVRLGVVALAVLPIALAILALTKTSWAMVALPVVLVVELAAGSLAPRRGLFGGVFAGAVAVLWLGSGQSIDSVVPHITTQLEVAGRFAEAMGVDAPNRSWVPVAYIVGIVVLLWAAWCSRCRGSIAALVGLTWCSFVVMKAGFVRHDHHELIATTFLWGIAVPIGVSAWSGTWWASAALPAALVLLASGTTHFVDARRGFVPSYRNALVGNAVGLISSVFGQPQWNRQFAIDMAGSPQVAKPPSLDMYPFGDALAMLRSGSVWACRPVFESYSAFSANLAQINRAHLASLAGPDQIRISFRPMDRMLPAMLDGHSWPEMMSRYAPASSTGRMVVLDKRPEPLAITVNPIGRYELTEGQMLELPAPIPDRLVWARIRVPMTLRGRIWTFLWKPSPLVIEMEDARGRRTSWRLVRGLAEAGFLLDPFIQTSGEFAQLLRGDSTAGVGIRRVAISGGWEYDLDTVEVVLEDIRVGP
jgi:hypothetical protein